MPDTTLGTQIGSVVSFSGSVWAVSENSHRPLTEGAPVYRGEEIVTEADSNVEIKFLDNTVLGQGGDSAVRLDDYVYSGDDGILDFHMVKGVLRVVSGEIVKANPENFNLTTPMATIGIRGTEVMVQIDHDREFIGVDKLGEGHTVLISNAFSQVVIDKAGLFSGVDFDGSLIVPDEMPDSFISTMVRAAPLTLLGDPPRSMGDPQEITPPQSYQTIDNQSGEYQPGVGQEQTWQDNDDDGDDDGELQLTEAEIEALLAMETAAGGDEATGPGESLGPVVDVAYDPYAPGSDPGDGTTPPPEDGGIEPDGPDDQDDPPPVEVGTEPPGDDIQGDDPVAAASDDGPDDGFDDTPLPAPPAESASPPPSPPPATGETATAEDQTVVQDPDAENTPVAYNVLTEGDSDGLSGGSLVAAELTDESPFEGTVEYNVDGTITYTPAAGETGTVDIDYVVEDADGGASMARLSIVLAADSAPVITTTDVSGDETGSLATGNGLLSVDFGADGSDAVIVLAAAGATWDGETAILSANDGSWAIETQDGEYAFTQYAPLDHTDMTDPDDPFIVDIWVTATDGDGTVSTGSFTVTVGDDGPTATDATFIQDTAPDDPVSYNVFTGGDASTGMDDGALTGAALTGESDYGGTVTYGADGTITYTPVEGETGTVDIEYMVTDNDGDSASAMLSIDLAREELPDSGEYLPGNGGDVIQGGTGDDTLDGGQGRDVIFGTGGNDVLIGGNSRDAILGGPGHDWMYGGKGNDLLIGGWGFDALSGGKGSDTFAYTSPYDGMDTLLDFQSAVDKIQLYESGFDLQGENGALDPGQFAVIDAATYEGGIDFEGASSGIVYASPDDCSAGTLYFDPNDTIDGDEIALASVTECDGSDLAAEDIEIV